MADYQFDLFVIGGGSGGLAAAKVAADLGAKVAVADFVKPSPQGTTWGLGGTCVNVGCIPKKLMHLSALYRETQSDAASLGWDTKSSHSWSEMVGKVNNYIKSLNWGAKTELRQKNIKYFNAFATFADPHTVNLDDGKGKVEQATFKYCLIACGGRPSYGDYPGAKECCISSDDIFWQKKAPGKTLVIGASYIALECAGFLAGFGFDTTVMVRSILLRGFDEEIAGMIGSYMEKHGVKFAREMVPSRFEKTPSGQVKVFVRDQEWGVFDTVLMAVGRHGLAAELNLKAAGLDYLERNGKIVVDEKDQTAVPHIFAVGDILDGKPELTPVAIQAGRYLVRRLFGGATKLMDYTDVATAVFTPIEYGTVGYSEQEAEKKLGKDNITVYHTIAMPLDWSVSSHRAAEHDQGYMKVICDKTRGEKVIGFHILGPHAGEVVQGLSVALKAGVTKEQLDDTVGIHPTFAESYTTMTELQAVPPCHAPPLCPAMLERLARDDGAPSVGVRILVAGDAAVGKSSLVEAICGGGGPSGSRSVERDKQGGTSNAEWTCGCALSITRETVEVGLRPTEVEVEVWEIGGTQTYAGARPVFYEAFDGLLLVYDVSNMKSYHNLVGWLFEICTSVRLPSLRYWDAGGGSGGVPEADLEGAGEGHVLQEAILSGRVPSLFVAHKCDLRRRGERVAPPPRPRPPDKLPLLDRLLGGDGLPGTLRRTPADERLLERLCEFVAAGRHVEACSREDQQCFDFAAWRDLVRRAVEARRRTAGK